MASRVSACGCKSVLALADLNEKDLHDQKHPKVSKHSRQWDNSVFTLSWEYIDLPK